jgi:O-antigen/teichoic acid export membrane protein
MAVFEVGTTLRSLLKNTFVASAAVQALGMAATTLVGIQLARLVGPGGYGEYGIAFAALSILGIPGEFGLAKLVMREAARAQAQGDSAQLFGVLRWARRTALLVSLAVIAIAAIFVLIRVGGVWTPVYLAVMIGLPLLPINALTAIQSSALMGLHQIVKGQIPILLLRPLLVAALLVPLFALPGRASPAVAMAINGVAAAAALALAYAWLRSALPERPEAAHEGDASWLTSAFAIAVVDGLRLIQAQIGILLIGIFADSEQAGIYRVATSIFILVSAPSTVVEIVTSPRFARQFGVGDVAGAQHLATRAAWLTSAAMAALTLGAWLFGRPLIGILFGEAFAPAYGPLLVLCAGQTFSALFGMNAALLLMTGHERQLGRAVLAGGLTNLIFAAALVPRFGAMGAAIGSVAYVVVWNAIAWHQARVSLKVNSAIAWPVRRPT